MNSLRTSKKILPQTKCFVDKDLHAAFYCSACHRPFCEKCAGYKDDSQTFCLECSIIQLNKPAKKEVESFFSRLPKKNILAVLAIVILCVNAYIIITGKESEVSAIRETPPMSVELSNLVECRHRLEALASLASDYKKAMGKLPDSIEDLFVLADNKELLYDPIRHKRYIIQKSKGSFAVLCPAPKAYGLSALFATLDKPAQMAFTK